MEKCTVRVIMIDNFNNINQKGIHTNLRGKQITQRGSKQNSLNNLTIGDNK